MNIKKLKNKTKKAVTGVGMSIALPTACIIGGIVLGVALGTSIIIMTAQELMEKE